jgi:hypothetical protein
MTESSSAGSFHGQLEFNLFCSGINTHNYKEKNMTLQEIIISIPMCVIMYLISYYLTVGVARTGNHRYAEYDVVAFRYMFVGLIGLLWFLSELIGFGAGYVYMTVSDDMTYAAMIVLVKVAALIGVIRAFSDESDSPSAA